MTAKDGPMTQAEKVQRLTQMTYKQYLQYYWSCPDDAFHGEYWRGSGSLLGAGGQAVSAADCWVLGRPGFPSALGLPSTTDVVFPGIGRTPQQDSKSGSGPTRAWPDGNISLLKLIVAKLIPAAQPDVGGARPTQTTILQSKTNYAALDDPASNVRIRLNSTVCEVVPAGRRRAARDGDVHRARQEGPQPERARPGQARDHGLLEPRHGAHRRPACRRIRSRTSATPARCRSSTAASR